MELARDVIAYCVRFLLCRLPWLRYLGALGFGAFGFGFGALALALRAGLLFALHARPRALYGVGQFMREQPIALVRARREFASAKVDRIADSERPRAEVIRRAC